MMTLMARTVLGILVGDVIFAGSAALLFYFFRVDLHAPSQPGFMFFGILCGVAIALLAGFVAGSIGKRPDLITGILLAIIIAIPALMTLISRSGQGVIWPQASALLLMAPATLVGDWLHKEKFRR